MNKCSIMQTWVKQSMVKNRDVIMKIISDRHLLFPTVDWPERAQRFLRNIILSQPPVLLFFDRLFRSQENEGSGIEERWGPMATTKEPLRCITAFGLLVTYCWPWARRLWVPVDWYETCTFFSWVTFELVLIGQLINPRTYKGGGVDAIPHKVFSKLRKDDLL